MADTKDPRDLTKRPPSRASSDGPDHVRVQGHGIRTTASLDSIEYETFTNDLQKEAHAEAQAEDYSRNEGRTTGAGPNPYRIKRVDAGITKKAIEKVRKQLDNPNLTDRQIITFLESSGESKAADAEIAIPGETLTDTGQKIVEKPDRVDAQERAILPRAGTPHEEATAEAGKDDLSAEKNPGALYGGNTTEQAS